MHHCFPIDCVLFQFIDLVLAIVNVEKGLPMHLREEFRRENMKLIKKVLAKSGSLKPVFRYTRLDIVAVKC